MKYIRNDLNYQIKEPTVITLGKFDGLHRGHELLMENLFVRGREMGCRTVVFTFDIPPRQQVEEEEALVLTTNEEKRLIFERTGVDYLYECPFTPAVMHMEPEAFLRWIVDAFSVRCIVVGNDFRFGHRRAGDCGLLRALADAYGYELVVVDKIQEEGRDISSTFVREELLRGRLERANKLLGYPFFMYSTVVHGQKLGRTIGIPTVNLKPPREKLLPRNGVYASRVYLNNESYQGITNVGCRPTVAAGETAVGVETHILGYDGDLYNRSLIVEFLHFIREEQKFRSVGELRAQIEDDIKKSIIYYNNITKNG